MSEYKVTIHKTGEIITGTDTQGQYGWLNRVDLALDVCAARGIEGSDVTVEIDGSEDFAAQDIKDRKDQIALARKHADTPEQQRIYDNDDIYGEEVAEMDAKSKALNS